MCKNKSRYRRFQVQRPKREDKKFPIYFLVISEHPFTPLPRALTPDGKIRKFSKVKRNWSRTDIQRPKWRPYRVGKEKVGTQRKRCWILGACLCQ